MTTESKLSEVQIAEIRKAFAVCDTEGKGVIGASQLRPVIRAIVEDEPTDTEMEQILAAVDKNKDGVISWDEFLTTMTDWLNDDINQNHRNKRRKLNPDQERHELHRQIKSFFSQFRPAQSFKQIRAKLQRYGSMSSSAFINVETPAQMHLQNLDDPSTITSSADKLKFLIKHREGRKEIPQAIEMIFGENPFNQIEGTKHMARLLSIVEVFATPIERRAVCDDILPVYDVMVKHNLPARFVKFIHQYDKPPLQIEALKALTYFAPGPRIASTPIDSCLHPSKFFFKRLIIVEQAVPVLQSLLESQSQEVAEMTAQLLGTIASHNPECRDFLIDSGAIRGLLNRVRPETPIPVLKNVSWALSILCGVTHSQLPSWYKIECTLPCWNTLLYCNNEEILRNVLVALALLLPGIAVDVSVIRRFVLLLSADRADVVQMTLMTLIDLARYDSNLTNALIQCGLLTELKRLLITSVKEPAVRHSVLDLISTLVSDRGRIQEVIVSEIISLIIDYITEEESLRNRCIKIIKLLTRGTPDQVSYLVNNKVITVLTKRLSDFKTYDQVLTEMYKFCGPTYNFDLAREILSALSNIVNVGEIISEDGINKYALAFDLDSIDKMGSVLEAIHNSKPSDINAWRSQTGEGSVENKV
eukprot:TRINITY_DN331_c1_g1_i2.p1 TRINITY_DN331_c1_g1~~TRINITY_DN331_c1_g1_i2.p1  ORF type:complete len:645 (+),score=128.51 TRINITY_DN331_c1_g1_i2:2-1936(+)